jgi:heat shock protein HslJ
MADVLNAEAGSQRARSVLIASSAIPGIFPPVLIDGHVHADGGVVSNVLIEPDRLGYQLLAKGLRAAGIEQPVKVRLWVIMNQWNFPKPVSINPASASEMSRRSSLLLFWTQQPQILQHLQDQARAVNAEFPGLRVEVHATAIPSELASEPGADKLFDKAWMDRMQTLGYSRAQSAAPWDEFVPVYARPAVIQSPTIQDMGLQNTYWKLLSIDGQPARVQDNVREPHLVFHTGGKLTGSNGCNRLMGGYTTHNDQLGLTPLATTRMACPDLDGSDVAFTSALSGVNRWRIKDNTLELLHDQILRAQFQATLLK